MQRLQSADLLNSVRSNRICNLPIDLDGSNLHPSSRSGPISTKANAPSARPFAGMCCTVVALLTCAWSHDHRLTVIRCSKGFSCSACWTEHRPGLSWARAMPFWALPNAIQHKDHHHPLLLNYRSRSTLSRCAICRDGGSYWGFYSCPVCDYYIHIMCAVSDDQNFEAIT